VNCIACGRTILESAADEGVREQRQR